MGFRVLGFRLPIPGCVKGLTLGLYSKKNLSFTYYGNSNPVFGEVPSDLSRKTAW